MDDRNEALEAGRAMAGIYLAFMRRMHEAHDLFDQSCDMGSDDMGETWFFRWRGYIHTSHRDKPVRLAYRFFFTREDLRQGLKLDFFADLRAADLLRSIRLLEAPPDA